MIKNFHIHIDWPAVIGTISTAAGFVVQNAPQITPLVPLSDQHYVGTAVLVSGFVLALVSKFSVSPITPPAAPVKGPNA